MKKSNLLKLIPVVCILLSLSITKTFGQPTIGFAERITGLANPLDIVNAGDGTNRLFVVEQAGAIRVFSSAYADLGTFLTVSPIQSGGEQGLLSLAFHPNYEMNGYFWVYYTNNLGNLEIARYQASGTSNTAIAGSKQVILTIPHLGESNHNGGKLWFGSDGFLYLATGDGGGAGDPDNSAQTGNNLLGKMIRINVGIAATANYTIPASNPYTTLAGDPGSNIMDEIFSFGLRNPFRWSFDPSGNVWIGDVGQGAWEEISRVTNASGVNFGWRCYEGNVPYPPAGCTPPGTTFPIYVYANGPGSAAVTGGMVYRGLTYPELQGYYYAADFYSGNIYKINTSTLTTTVQAGVQGLITAFGETENGELFVTTHDGTVLQLLPASALPVTLAEFKGINNNNTVRLDWKTLSEQNVQQFEVEFGTDGSSFTQAGVVAATNNPTGANYHFEHINTGTEKHAFYRLKMLDLDGSYTYSGIVRVLMLRKDNSFVHPSVITNGVINVFINNGFEQLRLLNSQGAIVKTQKLNGRTGNISMQVSSVPAGIYIVQLIGPGNIISQKVIINK